MLKSYFRDFHKDLVKKSNKTTTKKTAKKVAKKTSKKTAAKTSSKKAEVVSIDMKKMQERLANIIPAPLSIDALKPIDLNKYSAEGADFIIYKKYCNDIVSIMNGYIPYELIFGTFFVVPVLTRESLINLIKRVINVKKLNYYVDPELKEDIVIPSFIMAFNSQLSLKEIKEISLEYYMSNNIDFTFEYDIMSVVELGVIVKNWREKRSYIALGTEEDTNFTFFILMTDYLELNREPLDFRKYIDKEKIYSEF